MTKIAKDLTGNRYGKLTVLSRAKNRKKIIYWLCQCDCGKRKEISYTGLYLGTKSCGCLRKDMIRNRNKTKFKRLAYGEAAKRALYRQYKRHADERNLLFEIDIEYFANLTKMECGYCGSKPRNVFLPNSKNGPYIYNGIDRLDNTKGYIIENCVPCCETCNRAKLQMTVDEFINWIDNVYEYVHNK